MDTIVEYFNKFNTWLHEQGTSRQKWITVALVSIVVGTVAYVSGYLDGLF